MGATNLQYSKLGSRFPSQGDFETVVEGGKLAQKYRSPYTHRIDASLEKETLFDKIDKTTSSEELVTLSKELDAIQEEVEALKLRLEPELSAEGRLSSGEFEYPD